MCIRDRVCITLATGSSPRVDERILAAVGPVSYTHLVHRADSAAHHL